MEYTEDKLTEWFDFKKNQPTAVGVYEVKNTHCPWANYSYWDGCKFNYLTQKEELPDSAFNKRHSPTGATIKEWRGLSSDQSAPKKRAGNKRKTMYVVMDANRFGSCRGACGVFEKKENAQEYAEYLDFEVRIQKIRFRTPEA